MDWLLSAGREDHFDSSAPGGGTVPLRSGRDYCEPGRRPGQGGGYDIILEGAGHDGTADEQSDRRDLVERRDQRWHRR
jgi:hypothetical protein